MRKYARFLGAGAVRCSYYTSGLLAEGLQSLVDGVGGELVDGFSGWGCLLESSLHNHPVEAAETGEVWHGRKRHLLHLP